MVAGQTAWSSPAGDNRPLADRWNEAAAALRKIGGAPEFPISEPAVWRMRCAVAAAAPVVDDPALRAVNVEHFDLHHRYMRAAIAVAALQRKMSGAVNDWIHRLLGDVPENWNIDLPRELPNNTSYESSIRDVRAAVVEIMPTVLAAEGLQSRLDLAVNVAKTDPPLLHLRLIEKLFIRVEQLERQHNQVTALTERVANLERRKR
jgi:hypothetical protein